MANKIEAVIFDWAGTTVDFGCISPLIAFRVAFQKKKINVGDEIIKEHMGIKKWDHIKYILNNPDIKEKWKENHGKYPDNNDVKLLHDEFQSLLLDILTDNSKPVTGILETIEFLKSRGILIGSCTGYNDIMMKSVIETSSKHGFKPQSIVTSDMVKAGRPYPWMIYENMKNLNVYPPKSIIKVGDTSADIKEGINAGVISIGVSDSSINTGVTEEQLKNMDQTEKKILLMKSSLKLYEAGADYVVRTITELPDIIAKIESGIRK